MEIPSSPPKKPNTFLARFAPASIKKKKKPALSVAQKKKKEVDARKVKPLPTLDRWQDSSEDGKHPRAAVFSSVKMPEFNVQDVQGLDVFPHLLTGVQQVEWLTRLKAWEPIPRYGRTLKLSVLFQGSDYPRWYTQWADPDWNQVQIYRYRRGEGYTDRQEPLRCGRQVGILLLGDEWYHLWRKAGRDDKPRFRWSRGTALMLQGDARDRYTYELVAKKQYIVYDALHQKRIYRQPPTFDHWELVFTHV